MIVRKRTEIVYTNFPACYQTRKEQKASKERCPYSCHKQALVTILWMTCVLSFHRGLNTKIRFLYLCCGLVQRLKIENTSTTKCPRAYSTKYKLYRIRLWELPFSVCFHHSSGARNGITSNAFVRTKYKELVRASLKPWEVNHIIISAIVHPHPTVCFFISPWVLYITPHSIGLGTARIIGVVFRLEYRLYSTLHTCIWIEWPAVMNVCVIPVHYHSQLFRVENSSSLTPVSIPTALPFGVFARSFKIENLSLLVNLHKCLRCFYQVSFFFFWRSSELE